jgi:hypothetical protein
MVIHAQNTDYPLFFHACLQRSVNPSMRLSK